MSPRLAVLLPALFSIGCAGGPAPAPSPEPARPAPAAEPPAPIYPPPPVSAPLVAPAVPTAANGDGTADAGAVHGPSDDQQLADVKAANAFSSKLYARMKRAPGNVMISGTSVRQALEVAYLGARGDTAREMATALELAPDPAKAAALAKAENAAWNQARGKADLFVANRLWVDPSFPLKPDFLSAVESAFGAAAAPVDFVKAPDAARRTLNAWVAQKTADKIPDLMPEGSIDKRTRVVVTNAIYFKGKWSNPFPKGATKDEPFKTATKNNPVPMMHETDNHRFAHVGAVKVVEMRYDASQLGMLVVLPDDPAGLAKLEESVSADTFETWTKAISMQRVTITLPKFAFKWGGALATPLQELGIKSAFSPKADLSGIADSAPSGAERLQISQVMHRTWVSVDELGTEAAASTGLSMSTTSMALGPIAEFKADHPFLFFVYDAKRGRILFAGRVTEPKS